MNELQYHLIVVIFQVLEYFTKDVEQSNFAKPPLDFLVHSVESPKTPPNIIATIFRGFNGLLVSFSLSHSQRMLICSCALQHYFHLHLH